GEAWVKCGRLAARLPGLLRQSPCGPSLAGLCGVPACSDCWCAAPCWRHTPGRVGPWRASRTRRWPWAGSGLLLGQGLGVLDPVAANMIRFPVAAILFTVYVASVRPTERLTRRLVWLSLGAAMGTLASASMVLAGIAGAGV